MNKGRAGDVAAVPMQLAGSGINFRSSKTPTMIREPQALIRGDYRLGSTFPGGPSDLQTDINREKGVPFKARSYKYFSRCYTVHYCFRKHSSIILDYGNLIRRSIKWSVMKWISGAVTTAGYKCCWRQPGSNSNHACGSLPFISNKCQVSALEV